MTWTITRIRNTALLGIAGAGAAGAIALGPANAAHAADPVPMNPAAAPAAAPMNPAAPLPAAKQIADVDGALQPNGYYCGPAATRIALSAHGTAPTFDNLAGQLGTTRAGTQSIDDITRVLNEHTGGHYTSTKFDGPVSDEQTDKLRTDVMASINDGDPVVANIVGQVVDTHGETHRYAGGHYVTITGYTDEGHTVTFTDPADRKGGNEYQLPTDQAADWMATRGYTS
jgi:Peptidase_C39 like family